MAKQKYSNPNALTLRAARALVERVISAGRVPIVTGPPGVGKSDMYASIARDFNLKLIDIRLTAHDPADMNGYPCPNRERGRTEFLPIDLIPLEGDPLPKDANGKEMEGWLVLYDELPNAEPDMMKAAYKVLLDRMIGNRKIHPQVLQAAAGNRDVDNCGVNPFPAALESRMIHLEVKSDPEGWLLWAEKNGVDHRVTSYIQFSPESLNNFEPDHVDKTYACERTWHMCSDLVEDDTVIDRKTFTPLISGTVGRAEAINFLTYADVKKDMPTYNQVATKPATAPLPSEPAVLSAVVGMVANGAQAADLDNVVEYIERLPGEFQMLTARSMFRRKPELISEPAMGRWLEIISEDMF